MTDPTKPKRDMSKQRAGRTAAILQRKLDAAHQLLIEHECQPGRCPNPDAHGHRI